MREILFRGKRLDNGEWVSAHSLLMNIVNNDVLYHIGAANVARVWTDDHGNISCADGSGDYLFYAVEPETVGQFTGLTDKNGKKIFEGDILTIQNDTPFEMTGQIIFEDGCFQLRDPACDMYECLWYKAEEMEVVGTIHDNPELLEGGVEDGK